MESAVHLEGNGKNFYVQKVKENGHFGKRDYVCDFLFAFQYDAINLLWKGVCADLYKLYYYTIQMKQT